MNEPFFHVHFYGLCRSFNIIDGFILLLHQCSHLQSSGNNMRYCRLKVRACGDVHPQKAGRVLQEFAPFFSNSAAVLVLPCMRLVAPHKLQTKAVPLKKYQCLASRIRKKAAYSLSKYLLPSTFAHNINFFGSCVRFHYVLLIIRDARVSRGWQLTHQS